MTKHKTQNIIVCPNCMKGFDAGEIKGMWRDEFLKEVMEKIDEYENRAFRNELYPIGDGNNNVVGAFIMVLKATLEKLK